MTDLEMTKLCAQAMGWESLDVGYEGDDDETARQKMLTQSGWMHRNRMWSVGEYWIDEAAGFWIAREDYRPLTNDAQAMALVKRFHIALGWNRPGWGAFRQDIERWVNNDDLNRAIVECVAKMAAQGLSKVSLPFVQNNPNARAS